MKMTLTKIKYLGIHLTQELKDLYSENWKTLMKETEGHMNKWQDMLCSWIGRICVAQMVLHTPR